jgi:hypothetical protein|uniref:Uncharacterized protein n=1 Tax=Micromonas pusilla TaxID=38833 RepID=A0A7S0CTQ7_MICPS
MATTSWTARCATPATASTASARRSPFLGGARAFKPSAPSRSAGRVSTLTRCDVRKAWRSSRSMTLTIKDEDETHDFSTYISDGERIIGVTFPDESRREKLDDTTWRVQLLPFEFMQWRATVFTTLKLEARAGELRLSSEDLTIEGLPDELGVNGKVWLSMDGALKPARTGGKAGRKVLGKLTVNLSADVNEMIAILPGFDDAVNLINDTVIANLQGSINATVADDYAKWRVGESAKTRVNA